MGFRNLFQVAFGPTVGVGIKIPTNGPAILLAIQFCPCGVHTAPATIGNITADAAMPALVPAAPAAMDVPPAAVPALALVTLVAIAADVLVAPLTITAEVVVPAVALAAEPLTANITGCRPSESTKFIGLFATNAYKFTPPSSPIGSLFSHLPVSAS